MAALFWNCYFSRNSIIQLLPGQGGRCLGRPLAEGARLDKISRDYLHHSSNSAPRTLYGRPKSELDLSNGRRGQLYSPHPPRALQTAFPPPGPRPIASTPDQVGAAHRSFETPELAGPLGGPDRLLIPRGPSALPVSMSWGGGAEPNLPPGWLGASQPSGNDLHIRRSRGKCRKLAGCRLVTGLRIAQVTSGWDEKSN